MEVPTHKAAQHEAIQTEIDSYFAKGKEVETIAKGQMKPEKKTSMFVGKDGNPRRKKL
jgi:hypothetical protein